MPNIIIIEKNCDIRSLNLKNFNEAELYKKCNFKTGDNFEWVCAWNVSIDGIVSKVHLYGKTEGRANHENKYEFPPPADKILFFGSCALVRKSESGEEVLDLTANEWEQLYNQLHGGFEEVNGEDDEDDTASQEDEAAHAHLARTKEGYVKDDFIVDDDEDMDEDYEPKKKRKSVKKQKATNTGEKETKKKSTRTPLRKKKAAADAEGTVEVLPTPAPETGTVDATAQLPPPPTEKKPVKKRAPAKKKVVENAASDSVSEPIAAAESNTPTPEKKPVKKRAPAKKKTAASNDVVVQETPSNDSAEAVEQESAFIETPELVEEEYLEVMPDSAITTPTV